MCSSAKPGTHPRSSAPRHPALSSSSASRPHSILNRFSSLFHWPQPNTDESMELPHNPGPTISQHQHSPSPVESIDLTSVQALYIARQLEPVSEQVMRIKKLTCGAQGSGAVQDPSGQV
ncbi:hypothetical protein AZE42_08616 [Rhizopogon vesiculosus]|uniref:Uncharacterized protein n=1 Tax=Rhizopogon vesiculosus TaxID=180088 RepID=A0A1J8QMB8_9AGAM|nr:hypothetical protein AZE42_08616 [Rhizopogon vesiculosus]